VAEGQIKITADISQAEKELAKLDRALDSLGTSASDFGKFFAGITATAGAVAYGIKGVLDSAGELIDAANAIGVSAQQLSYLQKSAELAGIGADALNAGLIRLSKNIGEALIKGGDQATAAFTRLGIPLQQLAGMNPADQFEAITSALLNIPDRATRSALAVELLGKQGPMLLAAAENAKRIKEEMKSLGLALSDFDVQALDAAGDSLTELKQIFDSALKKAVAEIAPYIVAIVNAIKDAIKEAGGFEAIWGKIKEAIRSVVNIALIFAGILAGRVVVGAIALVGQLVIARGVMGAIVALMARTPIGLLVLGASILAEKLGVDVVGAMGETFDLSKYVAEAQADINKKVEETNKALKNNNTEVQEFTDEQKKIIAALDETIGKLQNQTQYQKDILQYGQNEADIRKVIKEESDKLAKVGLVLTNQGEERIRNAIGEEQATKRLISLRQQQGEKALALFQPTDAASQEFNKYLDLKKAFERDLTDEEIKAENIRETLANVQLVKDATGQDILLNKQRAAIGVAINAEAGKYDKLLALDVQYTKDRAALEQAQSLIKETDPALQEYKNAAIKEAMKNQDYDYHMAAMRLQSEAFANFSSMEDMKIQRAAETHAEQLRMQKDLLGNQLFSNDTIKQIAADRAAFEKKTDLERVQFGIDQGQTMFAALGAQNKKAFEASKALAVASAIVNTYQGATKALATYPFPFGLIAAAAAVAAGFAQVNAIKSQQYTGRALGGPVSEGRSYIVGEQGPEMFTPGAAGNITPNNQLTGGATNINFTIVANDTTGFDQLLTSRRGMIQQIVSDAMLEKGQRM